MPPSKKLSAYDPKKVNGGWSVDGVIIPQCDYLTALLYGFRHAKSAVIQEHMFWRVANLLWNQDPEEEHFAYHRWSRLIIHECCREKYLAIGGAGNSGKSYVMAGWGLVNWLAAPNQTLILITSTDLKGARGRIWGDVLNLGRFLPDAPWKIRDAIGEIVYRNLKTGSINSKAGLRLISADKGGKDKIGKMIGLKQKRLILIADELSDIRENVINAAVSNLSKGGTEMFQMVGMSNPSSRFDPFGVFSTPLGGWDSVMVENDKEWRTYLNGKFIRLDCYDSPNFDGGVYYPYLPDAEKIEEAKRNTGGEKSRGFMRMNRAIFFDSDESETVYTELEITRANATRQVALREAVRIAGVDPAYTSDGDSNIMVIADIGYDPNGQYAISLVEVLTLTTNAQDKSVPHTLQLCEMIAKNCEKYGVAPENLAIDATGGGSPIADILEVQFSPAFLRVSFSGAASKKRVSIHSKQLACERYGNRVSELWFIGKMFLMGRQFYGITPELCRQMASRTYETRKGGLLYVEPKSEYKARMKRSPDEADATFVMIELARQRHFFVAADPVPEREEGDTTASWVNRPRRTMRSFDIMSRTPGAFLT